MSRQTTAYATPLILIHWLTALCVLSAIGLGLYMTDLPVSPRRIKLYNWHKWLGMTALFLTFLRIGLRLTTVAPAFPPTLSKIQAQLAHVAHFGLYGLLLLVPLSGWLMSSAHGYPIQYLGWIRLPDLVAPDTALAHSFKIAHEILANGMIILLIGHVGAALKHQWLDRDNLFDRMRLFGKN